MKKYLEHLEGKVHDSILEALRDLDARLRQLEPELTEKGESDAEPKKSKK